MYDFTIDTADTAAMYAWPFAPAEPYDGVLFWDATDRAFWLEFNGSSAVADWTYSADMTFTGGETPAGRVESTTQAAFRKMQFMPSCNAFFGHPGAYVNDTDTSFRDGEAWILVPEDWIDPADAAVVASVSGSSIPALSFGGFTPIFGGLRQAA